jgi:hypothetical protein
MNKYPNHDYAYLQLLDYGVDILVTSKQNSIDLMIQHGSQGIYNVDNTKSSYSRLSLELLSTTSIELFGQQVFSIAHVDVNVNLKRK